MSEPAAPFPPAEQVAAELAAARLRIAELTEELDATNRGIIALHTDLESARAAEARAVADQEVASERDRIAAELRDQVVQRVFAAGMSLQGALGLIQNKTAAGRVRAVVTELDAVIAQLRAAVFATEDQARPAPRLRVQLNDLAARADPVAGRTPSLGFRGPIDESVPEDVAAALLDAVQAAFVLVPVTATRIDVHVEADAELTLLVDYDGPEPAAADLAALNSSARSHGGAVAAEASGGGTRVSWRVPLPEPPRS
ncbi:MAG: hypothetical protein HOW97_31910 [Catenulispora sp.]|nr:hypothetical protein [Catenulispora sp.]